MVTIIRNYRIKIRKTENKFIFFIQYLGEKMSDFKFVCREEELNFVQEALLEKKFIIYYYFNDSGLTHYLKKLNSILNTDNEICFYVDCIKSQSIAIQIATQIISCFDKKKLSQYTKSNGEVIKKIIESLSSSIDIIPFVNAGELVSSFADAIKDTLDTDIEHLSDYKIEKAIISMLGQIEKKGKIRKVYILVDDASSLKPEGIEFVAKIMDFDIVRTLLTIPNNHIDPGMENLSKICANDYKPYELEKIFKRPNDTMIKGLFRCYEQNYNDDYLNIFNRYERNIHVIMSYIRGFHMDFMQLDKPSICILKILLILGTPLDIVTLKTIYIRNAHLPTNIVEADFNVLINKMSIQGFIARDQRDCIHLNNNIVSEKDIKITLIERLSISRDIIDTFEICKMQLTCSPMVRDFFDETGVPILYMDLTMQMMKNARDIFTSMDSFHAITVGAYQKMNRLSDVPLTTEYAHNEPQSCAGFEDIFGLAYQSAAIGYYFGEKKDHMSTPVIADEAARETLAKEGVEIIEKLVERMDMNHIVAQMRELEHYNSEVAKKCPWVPSNTKTER